MFLYPACYAMLSYAINAFKLESQNDFGQVVYIHVPVDKQYNLVMTKVR